MSKVLSLIFLSGGDLFGCVWRYDLSAVEGRGMGCCFLSGERGFRKSWRPFSDTISNRPWEVCIKYHKNATQVDQILNLSRLENGVDFADSFNGDTHPSHSLYT